jgi:hypothetical protein
VFGKTSASPRMRGTRAAGSSGPNIVLKRQGLSLCSLGSNGSSARAVEQVLHQLRLRRWRWQMERLPSKTNRNSERDLGRLGLPARTGPEARLQGAGDQPAIRKPFLPPSRRWLSGGWWLKQIPAQRNGKSGSETKN